MSKIQMEEKLHSMKEISKIHYLLKADDRIVAEADYQNIKVLVKIGLKENQDLTAKISKECTIGRILKQIYLENDILDDLAKIVECGADQEFAWLVREYIQGEPMAEYIEEINKEPALISYSKIKECYLNNWQVYFGQIVSSIKKTKIYRKKHIDELIELGQRFPTKLSQNDLGKCREAYGPSIETSLSFYDENIKQYTDRANMSPVFGDLVPSNIIINKNEVKYTDLEYFSFDNSLVDIAWLWLFLYSYPDIQDYIIKNTIKTQQEEINFRCSVIRMIVGYRWYAWFKDNQDHPWHRYAREAGESYQKLTNSK
jgi:serine/threonine protein kinase